MPIYVCPPDHKHDGSAHCYKRHGCRCRRCKTANTARGREYRRRREAGTLEPLVDATPVREHIAYLSALGYGYRVIAARAGVGDKPLGFIANGRTVRVFSFTADAILGVTPDILHLKPGRQIDATGSRRRVQALVWIGWPIVDIAARLGMKQNLANRLVTQNKITKAGADRVAALYEELIQQPTPEGYGPNRARLRARRLSWHGPDAWIDVDIDDPTAEPDTSTAPDKPGWMLDELAHFHSLGESAAVALAAIPADPTALERQALRHHRNDIAAWIRTAGRAA